MWLLLFIFEPLVEFRLTRPVSAGSLKVRGNIFLLCCQSYDVNFDQTGCPPLWLCCNCSYSSSSSTSNVPWKASTVRNAFFENTPPLAREVSLTSWHFSTGATQIQEGGEGASGWGSAVCCRAGSRSRPSVPGAASLWVTHHLNCQGGKLSGLSPTWDFLLCRCCRGLKSWSTSGSRMTSGPLLFARPSSCSGPPCWRARCFWGDSIEKK